MKTERDELLRVVKNTKKAVIALTACKSWRGRAFDVVNGGSSVGRYAKRVTKRAARRLDKALERDAEC